MPDESQLHPLQTPKQDSILKELRNRIVTGKLPAGARLPTHIELSREFQVSTVTIQRTLDRLRFDGFIVARGRRGTFVTDRPPHISTYGIVFADALPSPSRFMNSFAHVAENASRDGDRRINVYTAVDHASPGTDRERLASDVSAHRVGGLVFMHLNASYQAEMFDENTIPCVANGGPHADNQIPGVYLDWRALVEMAVERLAQRKRRRIALLTIAYTFDEDLNHFRDTLAKHGMETDRRWMIGLDPQQPQWADHAMHMMLSLPRKERPDGLIITDEHLVASASQGIVASGLRVPDDLDVIGHCSYPDVSPAPLRFPRLGFDLEGLLAVYLSLLDQQRAGEKVPAVTRYRPIFDNEKAQLARH